MSESYRALNRVYRPKSFEEIVSQGHVSNTLMNAIKQNRLSHAYMFCGPRGVGKTTMARVLARKINGVDEAVDGEQLNQTLNIVEIDAASHNKVEDIHQLRDSVRIPPQNGRYKIFIIDEVHMLSKAAFNALLKTLEEPPAHAIFIFATTEPHKVLPTILSRVQRFDFRRISTAEIREQLTRIAAAEGITIDEESLQLISQKADGALRDALGLMDQAIAFCGREITYKTLLGALHAIDIDQLFELSQIVADRRKAEGLQKIDALLRAGTDIQEFLVSWMQHLRNLYVARVSAGEHLLEATPETRARYQESAKGFAPEDILRMMHLVNECQIRIREAQQPRIQLELLFLRLLHLTPAAELAHLRASLEEVKKKSLTSAEDPQNDPSGVVEQEEVQTSGFGANTEASTLETEAVRAEPMQAPRPPDHESQPVPQVTQQPVPQAAHLPAAPQPLQQQPAAAPTAPPAQPRRNPIIPTLSPPSLGFDPELAPQRSVFSSPAPSATSASMATPTSPAPPKPEPLPHPGQPHRAEQLPPHPGLPQRAEQPAGSEQSARPDNPPRPEQHARSEDQARSEVPAPGLHDVKTAWSTALDRMEEDAPKFLIAQLRRVVLRSLTDKSLIVEVDNEFAARMVEEQRLKLQSLLRESVNRGVTISVEIVKPTKEQRTALNPYDEFKEVQQRDPIVGRIVELFGAELQY